MEIKYSAGKLLFILLYMLFIDIPVSNAQNSTGKGNFFYKNYTAKEYKAHLQNWAIVQDSGGLIYIGNGDGILEYDGVNWRLIPTTNGATVRSLAIDSRGVIYVGAKGEFGYLWPDSVGKTTFYSLSDSLTDKNLEFADVWKTFATKDGIYFQTFNSLFLWKDKKIKIWEPVTSFHLSFYVNGGLYIRENETGLVRLVNDSLIFVSGSKMFANEGIYVMLPYKNDEILIGTRNLGFFIYNGISFKSFKTEIDNFILKNSVYQGVLLSNGHYAFGTFKGGIATMNKNGVLDYFINKQAGLHDNFVLYMAADNQNALWVALNNGVSRIEIGSPFTIFNQSAGFDGKIFDIVRHKGTLYITTSLGVYYFENARFYPVKGISTIQCWDLLSSGDMLFVATNTGIYKIQNKQASLIRISSVPSISLYRSEIDLNRIFIGLTNGLASMYLKKGHWINAGILKNVNAEIRTITEDKDSNIWLGTSIKGVIKVKLNPDILRLDKQVPVVKKYSLDDGLPDLDVQVFAFRDYAIFTTDKGICRYNAISDLFVPDTVFGIDYAKAKKNTSLVIADHKGNYWLSSSKNGAISVAVPQPGGSMKIQTAPFQRIPESQILSIYPEENGIVWFGGSEGLIKYNSNEDIKTSIFNTLIRRVKAGEDSVIFEGATGNSLYFTRRNQNIVLSYKNNSLQFEFASTGFDEENRNRYQIMLDGYKKVTKWSDWNSETYKEYTNLSEGKYTFKVRAKNIYETVSHPAFFEFEILPPWYRTLIAFIIYLVLAMLIIILIVKLNSKRLQRDKENLEIIVKERTSEIEQQKEEIQTQKNEIEKQHGLVSKQKKEITDSIIYSKHIQNAILPSKEYIHEILPHSFILYNPKEIIGGDFYWAAKQGSKTIVAVADCTGHGVPGALMSMIGITFLNEIVNNKNITRPAEILNSLRKMVIKTLHQTGDEESSQDGMDIAICVIDYSSKKLKFAGANNPILICKNNEYNELSPDKMPIRYHHMINNKFAEKEISIDSNESIYLFSDGYADQFGIDGSKFLKRNFREMLYKISRLPFPEQEQELRKNLVEWRGNVEQIDDITVLGFKI